MICLTGLPMVFAGNFLPAKAVTVFGMGLHPGVVSWIIFAQLFVGGVPILYMDEVISKWGVGSSIGLFANAGVSQRLIGGLFSTPFIGGRWFRIALGDLNIGPLLDGGLERLLFFEGQFLPLFTTVLVIMVVVYAESVRVEIPLSNARVKGARGRFPVKLIYASVLPMIHVRALQANVQFIGRILNALLCWTARLRFDTYVIEIESEEAGCCDFRNPPLHSNCGHES